MSNNGRPAVAVPLVGQPFTLSDVFLPVNATLACNCAIAHGGAPTTMQIMASALVTCPSCQTGYRVVFNPSNGQLAVIATRPEVPS